MKGMLLFHDFDGFAQEVNMGNQQVLVSIQQVDGEEIAPAGDAVAAIIGHASSVVDFVVFGESNGNDGLRYANPSYAMKHQNHVGRISAAPSARQ